MLMIQNNKINILMVDDRVENLVALQAVLENEDYRLLSASSGEEALKYVLKYDIAVILMDVQMPGLSGFETATIMKERKNSRHIPIIFVTAISKATEHVQLGYSTGAIDYIFKPYNPTILRSKVAALVEIYKWQQELKVQKEELEYKAKELNKGYKNLELIVADKTKEL